MSRHLGDDMNNLSALGGWLNHPKAETNYAEPKGVYCSFFYKILLTLIPTEILLLVIDIVSCPQWLFSRQSRDGPHGVCGDALCLLLLTPVCLTSVYLCGMGSLAYLQRGAWEGVGLAFLSLIVLFTFFVWGFTTVR